jgi:hypothetical protein
MRRLRGLWALAIAWNAHQILGVFAFFALVWVAPYL